MLQRPSPQVVPVHTGVFPGASTRLGQHHVVPVNTGVFLWSCIAITKRSRYPRAHGGIPFGQTYIRAQKWLSPYARGYSALRMLQHPYPQVVPVYTRVFPHCQHCIDQNPRCTVPAGIYLICSATPPQVSYSISTYGVIPCASQSSSQSETINTVFTKVHLYHERHDEHS